MWGCSLGVPTLLGGDVALAWHAPGGVLRPPFVTIIPPSPLGACRSMLRLLRRNVHVNALRWSARSQFGHAEHDGAGPES